MHNSDAFSSLQMQELRAVRAQFGQAYDELWRLERMLRYIYWLDHGEQAPFNLIGSWTQADLQAELAMWTTFAKKRLDLADVIDPVADLLEQRYGLDLASANVRATDVGLASRNLPIWNVATGSLIPQSLGPWLIYSAQDNERESKGLGMTYRYRQTNVHVPLTLYVYDNGCEKFEPGIGDERMAGVVERSLREVEVVANSEGNRVEWLTEPLVERMQSRRETEVDFISSTWNATLKNGAQETSAFSITGFRGHLLKIRLTGSVGYLEHDDGQAAISELNLDLADFIEQFGP